MFESLSDRIKQDDQKEEPNAERMIKWAVVAVISVLIFGGLYFGVSVLQ
jgi:hypothetical protein